MGRLVKLSHAVGCGVAGAQHNRGAPAAQTAVDFCKADAQPSCLALETYALQRGLSQQRTDGFDKIVRGLGVRPESPAKQLLAHRLGNLVALGGDPDSASGQPLAQIRRHRTVGRAGEPYQVVERPRLARDDAAAQWRPVARAGIGEGGLGGFVGEADTPG